MGLVLFGVGLSVKVSSERVLLEIDQADNISAIRRALGAMIELRDVAKLELHLRAISSESARTAAAVEILASTVRRPPAA